MLPPSLIETMRVVGGRIPLLDAHIRRYHHSAAILGYVASEWKTDAVSRAVDAEDSVLRVQIDAMGSVEWSSRSLPERRQPITVAVSNVARDTSNPLLQIKNTDRWIYEEAAQEALSRGVDYVLIRSKSDQITETSIHTLLYQAGGKWWTPPLSDGLLAGVVRAELLRRGVVGERSFTSDEAKGKPPIALCNAVVGVVSARWWEAESAGLAGQGLRH